MLRGEWPDPEPPDPPRLHVVRPEPPPVAWLNESTGEFTYERPRRRRILRTSWVVPVVVSGYAALLVALIVLVAAECR